jgi:hypothetical protein
MSFQAISSALASIRTPRWQLAYGWVLDSGPLSASVVWVRV